MNRRQRGFAAAGGDQHDTENEVVAFVVALDDENRNGQVRRTTWLSTLLILEPNSPWHTTKPNREEEWAQGLQCTFYRFKPLGVVVGDRSDSLRRQPQIPKRNLFPESRSVHHSANVFGLSACPALLGFASHRRRTHRKKRRDRRARRWRAGPGVGRCRSLQSRARGLRDCDERPSSA